MIRRLLHRLIPSSILAAIRRNGLRLRHAGWSRWCPVCRSRLRQFLPYWAKPDSLCPVCESLERQRLSWLYLREELSDGRHRRVLHIAPEEGLSRRLRALPWIDYLSADPCNPQAMIRFDLTRAPFEDRAFDVILISHVLQHIDDEWSALSELRRLLAPEGWIMMTESFRDGPTVAGGHAVTAKREKAFHGYFDATLMRQYGTDFGNRLLRHGLAATYVPFGDRFDEVQCRRMGLGRPKNFYIVKRGPRVANSPPSLFAFQWNAPAGERARFAPETQRRLD